MTCYIPLFLSFVFANPLTKIDKDLIRTKIQDNMTAIKLCYEDNIIKNKKVLQKNGKVVVQFTVDDTGKVKEFGTNEKTTLNNSKLFSCMQVVFEKMSFPPAPKGEEATIKYPFIFNQTEEK